MRGNTGFKRAEREMKSIVGSVVLVFRDICGGRLPG